MCTKIEINEGHFIELTDRIHIIVSNIEDYLIKHPLLLHENNKELKSRVEKASELLVEVYQMTGNLDEK